CVEVVDYFFAVGFLAGAFFAAGFLAAVVAVVFFGAAAFLGAALAAGFASAFAAGFFGAGAFFVVASSLTPASFATLARFALRRAAVFFEIRFFLTAVSISLCAAERPAAVGFSRNDLTAFLMSRLVPTLRSRRLTVCFIRFIADLMIGMLLFTS